MATHPPDLEAMLAALLPGVRAALGDNLTGVYLRGSLALGDFDPVTSDLDYLVVTEQPVSEAEFDALAALHARLAALPNRYADHLEGSYIDRGSLRRFRPGERRHPTLGPDWAFGRREHGDEWVLERWILRERGVALVGPPPDTLIEPISADDLCAAVRGALRTWGALPDAPEWLLRRNYQAFAVETMCRALHTLATGELASKPRAVAWALERLSEPWRGLVTRSRAWRADTTPDAATRREVMRFVRWTASAGEGLPGGG